MRTTLPNGKWRKRLKIKALPPFAELHKVRAGNCKIFSLNPNKKFKPFNEKSDIDVSIISQYYFEVAWHDLLYTSRNVIQPKMKEALDDHRQRLIYWGTVATDKILPLLSFGSQWDKIINESKVYPALEDRDINFRIYKDRLSIRNYLTTSISKLKSELLEDRIR